MKKPLSSIVTLTLLLTKPVGTVMDKASVLEVFRYKSPWSLYDLVSLLYNITSMAITNEKDHNMMMLKVWTSDEYDVTVDDRGVSGYHRSSGPGQVQQKALESYIASQLRRKKWAVENVFIPLSHIKRMDYDTIQTCIGITYGNHL